MKRLPTQLLGLALLCAAARLGAVAAFPYPQNISYAYGFKPAPFGGSAAADASTILTKYNSWKASHVVSAGAGMLRVQRDAADGNDTVSEGISYGMLMAVYFNDQTTFDQLWAYKQSKNDGFGLMHWKISSGGAVTGANSAADADEDIAYSLYLAHYQWGSGGALNYKSLADAEMTKIVGFDLDSNRVKPGDAFNDCRNPSYFFPNEYRVFAKEKPADAATWTAVRANCYTTLAAANNNTTGLVPEQCNDSGTGGGCTYISQPYNYYYNSARVPFRLALDYVYYGDANANAALTLLGSFFGGIAPSAVVDCYQLNGTPCSGYNAGTFVGPAGTAFMRGGGANLQSYYNYLMTTNYSGAYFDGSISIMSLLLLSGNMPNIGDQGAMFTPTRTRTPTPYAGTPTFTPTATPIAFAYIFEDFENAILVNTYNYTGPATVPTPSLSSGISNLQALSGSFSDRIQVYMPTVGQYAGHGFDSSYAPASGVMNFSGATSVRYYVKTDQNISIRIAFREGLGAPGGVDEVWQSALIPLAASAAWQVVNVNLSTFTENQYNPSCQPNCLLAGNGNNAFDLSMVKAAEISFNPTIATMANVYIDDIAFVPSVVPTMTFTKTPFPNPFTQIYDDFEPPLSLAAPQRVTSYANTAQGASAAWAFETTAPLVGARSARLNYNLGTAPTSYGGGGSFLSPYTTGSFTSPNALTGQYVNANGAVRLQLWLWAPVGLKYRLTFQEAGSPSTPVNGADGEGWYTKLYTGSGGWQQVVVDINEFVEDPYNTLCNPSSLPAPGPCLSGPMAGNGVPNMGAIWQVGLKLPGEQVGVASRTGTVYLDDVAFITSYQSPTVSPTFTPGAASPTYTRTRTPTPSSTYTRTPTPSPTRTPSPTSSRTASASATLTRTPTATSSPSRTATPAGTPSFTASSTSSPSRTVTPSSSPTASATGTPSATRTRTPTRTATTTFTAASSPTFSATASRSATATSTASPSPSRTPSASSTASPSSTRTRTPSPSPSPTRTASPTGSATATRTGTRTATPSYTDVPAGSTETNTPTISPTWSASPSRTSTPSSTSTATLSWSPSRTATLTPTPTLTASPTRSASASSTVTPNPSSTRTSTSSPTPSSTSSPASTATPTSTVTLSHTASPLASATSSSTITATFSPSPTASQTPLVPPTGTPTSSSTAVIPPSSTPSSTATALVPATATPTRTRTATALSSSTSTATPTRSATPVSTFSSTATPSSTNVPPGSTATSTPTPSPSSSATPSATGTSTRTATPSATPSRSSTPSATLSSTAAPSSSATPPPSATPSATPTLLPTPSGAGQGSASVSPTQVNAGSGGLTLSFTFTAGPMAYSGGSLTLSVPLAWGPPSLLPSDLGYVTVAGGGAAVSGVSGQTVTISVPALPSGGIVSVALGSTSGGGPGLTAPAAAGLSTFLFASDPTGAAPAAIASQPQVDVKAPATAGPTATSTASGDGPPIVSSSPLPNPNPSSIQVTLRQGVDRLTLRVYSRAMVAVDELSAGPFGPGQVNLGLPPKVLAGPNGGYFYVITCEKQGALSKAPKIGRLVLAR